MPVFPSPVAPGRSRSPWAFPCASHPAVTGHARHGGDRSWTLTRSHVVDISRPPIHGLAYHVHPHVAEIVDAVRAGDHPGHDRRELHSRIRPDRGRQVDLLRPD